ncbi:TetR/AcrR family transcriptional regulator [Jidongwangia harbinensis]|uniref:TetR/AcrR family transcriptional regulator n=1 Tax=Jidongwangia harbinensis TaxID=2878561 RepID=UPI001CD9ACDB|nr:TetR/AcrR family transcriptional regulator [Jidongwangia harbinensis]MCA2218523.1 TetR/AcrR family transcriptional regulator [Jidongwangia harbinensis]
MPRRSQRERSDTTRAALVATARELFGDRGYAHVPADEVVRRAGVTRGAMYHHYADKRDLFRAVLEEVESEITEEIAAAVAAAPDRAAGLVAAVRTMLGICRRPAAVRIVLIDAPAVLGWQEWRAVEERYGLRLITGLLDDAARDGQVEPAAVPILAQLALSAVIEAALIVAHAEDREKAVADAERALLTLLSGLLTGDRRR